MTSAKVNQVKRDMALLRKQADRIAELEAKLAKAEKYSRLPEAAADRIKMLEAEVERLRKYINGDNPMPHIKAEGESDDENT